MHHSIWTEHDGSWTWSIEEGKAFEDDHKVLARDDGFPTRGDAKEDMQKAWARLLAEGKKPGRIGKIRSTASAATKKSTPAPKTGKAKTSLNGTTASSDLIPTLPEWAVIVNDQIVAMFTSKSVAETFAKSNHAKSHSIEKIRIGAVRY